VASLAGVQPTLQALARIEAGSTDPADFEAVGDRWDMPQRLHKALARHGLAHLHADQPARQLSGGEAMRVALVGAFLS
jgi:ATPase subunit of ABC transporter with duplicated ATPase domains